MYRRQPPATSRSWKPRSSASATSASRNPGVTSVSSLRKRTYRTSVVRIWARARLQAPVKPKLRSRRRSYRKAELRSTPCRPWRRDPVRRDQAGPGRPFHGGVLRAREREPGCAVHRKLEPVGSLPRSNPGQPDKRHERLGQLLGHKTAAMTMRYAHLSPEHLQEAVRSLPTWENGPVLAPSDVGSA